MKKAKKQVPGQSIGAKCLIHAKINQLQHLLMSAISKRVYKGPPRTFIIQFLPAQKIGYKTGIACRPMHEQYAQKETQENEIVAGLDVHIGAMLGNGRQFAIAGCFFTRFKDNKLMLLRESP